MELEPRVPERKEERGGVGAHISYQCGVGMEKAKVGKWAFAFYSQSYYSIPYRQQGDSGNT